MTKVNVKFKKDRGEFKKDDVISINEYSANNMITSDPSSCEITEDKATLNGGKLKARQEEAHKKKIEVLKKKAKSLES